MKVFGNFVKWFLYIAVGIMIVCGISYGLAGMETVPVDIFWMILLSAFATALVTVLIQPQENDGKGKACLKNVLHYVILCVIMCFLGVNFGWMNLDMPGIGMMAIDVGIVYLLVFVIYYIVDSKQADEINRMLQEKYGDEEL